MVDFSSMMDTMRGSGFDTFVLPWILFLVIIYSIVMKAPFLKGSEIEGQKKQISVVIAAILSFFIVNFQWQGQLVGEFLTQMFGAASLYMAGALVLILFLGMGGWKMDEIPGGKSLVIVVMVLVAVMIFFNTGASAYFNMSEEAMTWVFMLLLVGGALYYLGQGDDGNSSATETKPEGH